MKNLKNFALVIIMIFIVSCSGDSGVEEDFPQQPKSNNSELLQLQLEYQGNTYATKIEGLDILLVNPLPFNAQEITIKNIDVSPKANSNVNAGNKLLVNQSPISITITAEDSNFSKTYKLKLLPFAKNNEANVLKLELLHQNVTYTTTISDTTIELVNPLPFNTQEVTIKFIDVSPNANVDKKVSDKLQISQSPISITVTAEDPNFTKTYKLKLLPLAINTETNILKLELLYQGETFSTIIDNNKIVLEKVFPYGAEVSIKTIEISPDASVDVSIGRKISVNEDPITITVTSSKNNVNNTFKLYLLREVHILIIDGDDHGQKVLQTVKNELQPWSLSSFDVQHRDEVLFDLHKDIKYAITENYDNFNPNKNLADIVNMSTSIFILNSAISDLNQFLDIQKFPEFPLIVTSAGNGGNKCTQTAWNLAKQLGGIDHIAHLAPYYNCDIVDGKVINCSDYQAVESLLPSILRYLQQQKVYNDE